jgi:hypothetical protein
MLKYMELVNRLRPPSTIELPLPGPDPIGSGGPKKPMQTGIGDGRFLGLGANWMGQMGTPWTGWGATQLRGGLGANPRLEALMKMFSR